MGKIKNSGEKKYILTQREFDYLRILNTSLSFHTLKDKIISGFLYYVCNQRLGYGENTNLQFEIDLEDDKRELKLKEIPTETIVQALEQERPHPKPQQ